MLNLLNLLVLFIVTTAPTTPQTTTTLTPKLSIGLKWVKTIDLNNYFVKLSNTKWNEVDNGKVFATFKEIEFGNSYVILYDETRYMFIKLTNGPGFYSMDNRTNWFKFTNGNFDSLTFITTSSTSTPTLTTTTNSNLWKATEKDYLFVKNEDVWNEFQDGILLNSYKLIEQNVLRFILYDSKRSAYVALTNQNASIYFSRYGEYSLFQTGTWISGSDAKCSGWIYFDNSCYLRVKSRKSFYSAQNYCQSLNKNSHLVFINDLIQLSVKSNYWKNLTNFWTGLYAGREEYFRLNFAWLDRTNKSINWCSYEPSNSGVRERLHDGCAFFDTKQLCLISTPCRNGELDSLESDWLPSVNEFICQYSLTINLLLIQLPIALNTLESGFFLHTNEYLMSSNKIYKLILADDGNLIVLANDSFRIWSTNTTYSAVNPNTVVVYLCFYGDLIMIDNQGKYIWKSESPNSKSFSAYQTNSASMKSAYQLKLEDDGTLNILDNRANIFWSSNINSLETTTIDSSLLTTTESQILTEGSQCGGIGYIGLTKCPADLTCYIMTDYFSQCVQLPNSDCILFPNSISSNFKDWRNVNGVSPVKNQQTCNACWAFAIVAALESFSLIINKEAILFSEQNLLDCAGVGNCTAGFPDVGVLYALRNGIQQENQYRSYNSTQISCQNTGATIVKIPSLNGYQTIVNDEILMKTVLDKIGPIIVSFNADPLNYYKPGDIIDNKLCSHVVNHNGLAVGYGTDNVTGLDYYIVKNSWGTEWGDKGYFRIARGKNMCGIGQSAIYLCPNKVCRETFIGLSNYMRTVNCQCGGRGFLGTSVCANQGSCFKKYPEYNEFTSSNSCPSEWDCNQITPIHKAGLQLAGLDDKCDMSIGCSVGNCYAQNGWFSQCKISCPKGWSCRNPTVNSSNLNLWQYARREEYFKRIDNQTWVYIINSAIIYNLTQISSSNDTVILYDSNRMYFRLSSESCYTSSSLDNIFSSKFSKGSWIVVYYESKDKTSVWTFQDKSSIFLDSYFVNIESLAKETWVLFKDDSSFDKTQIPNLGINSYFQVINKTERDVILFTKYDLGNAFPYYKLNISSLTLGSCKSSICNASLIEWNDNYLGTWTFFYPNLFLYGPAPTTNNTKATTTPKTTTTTKLTTTTTPFKSG